MVAQPLKTSDALTKADPLDQWIGDRRRMAMQLQIADNRRCVEPNRIDRCTMHYAHDCFIKPRPLAVRPE